MNSGRLAALLPFLALVGTASLGRAQIQIDPPPQEIDAFGRDTVGIGEPAAAEDAQDRRTLAPEKRIALHLVNSRRFEDRRQPVERAERGG